MVTSPLVFARDPVPRCVASAIHLPAGPWRTRLVLRICEELLSTNRSKGNSFRKTELWEADQDLSLRLPISPSKSAAIESCAGRALTVLDWPVGLRGNAQYGHL